MSYIMPQGRWWSKSQLAAHFTKSVDWLTRNYADLLSQGMPDKDPLFKAWDSQAIIAWEDERSMIKVSNPLSRDAIQFEQQLANGEI